MRNPHAAITLVAAILLLVGCKTAGQQSYDGQVTADAAVVDAAPSDAALADAAVDATTDAGPWTYACTPVGDSFSDGFFSLAAFNGKVYAGQFGYGYETQSMMFRYPAWEHVLPGLTGISESVCALREHSGFLYANTESSGDIFRSADGTTWQQVHDGDPGAIGCGLAELGGQLYAVNYGLATESHGRILRNDGGSWTVVYDSQSDPLYLREIVAYQGTLYAFGVMNNQGQMLQSTNGTDWTGQAVANRYFRGHVWGDYLWLGSSTFSAAGEVAVWRFDGVNFLRVHPTPDQTHVADLQDFDGQLFAATSHGWKTESGPSYLLKSPDGMGDWQRVCTFSETAAWSMAVLGDALYVGTWEYTQGGRVYRVTREPVTATDCSAISAHADWELCESSTGFCAGVFNDSAGCPAFCAAVGLPATACYGGEPGCQAEPQNPLDCTTPTGHQSDWCECGTR